MSAALDAESVFTQAKTWYGENWDRALSVGEWWDLLADAGWAFPTWPQGLGGRGLTPAAAKGAVRARQEVGAFGPPNGIATFLTAPTLLHYGTDDQLARYMPRIANGRDPWCQLFSEPGSGSDMAGLATRAERDGDEWVISGQKVWNSGAQFARYGILIARTDVDQPKHKGITYFLIDMHQEGVEVRPLREMTGDAAFNEVFLSEARVADADRLGELGEGWRVAMTTLAHERDPDNAGMSQGAAFGAVDRSTPIAEYVAAVDERIDGFSLAISGGAVGVLDSLVDRFDAGEDPVARQKLMRILEMRRNSRWSGRRALATAKAGGQPGPEVSTLKLLGSEIGRQIRDAGLDVMGPAGMLSGEDAPERGLFHAYSMFTPAMSIAGGTDEVQRNIIGERVLGLPREPGEAEQRDRPWSELPAVDRPVLLRAHDDATSDEANWRSFVRAQGFGHFVAGGGHEVPTVVPTQFLLEGDEIVFHLARQNPVFARLAPESRCIMSVAGDWAYIPGSWKAVGDEDPRRGVPTTYYGAVQLTGTATVLDDAEAVAAILRRQIAALEPDADYVDPRDHGAMLRGIRGISVEVDLVRAKFKYGGNVDLEHRGQVATRLDERGGPGDADARRHIDLAPPDR